MSSPSLSEISSVRPCLLLLGVQDSSNRPFCKETRRTERWRVMGKSSSPTGLHRLQRVRHSHHGTCVNDTSRATWPQDMTKSSTKTGETGQQFLGKCKMVRMGAKRDSAHLRKLTEHGFLSGSLLAHVPGSSNGSHPVWAVLGHPTLVF